MNPRNFLKDIRGAVEEIFHLWHKVVPLTNEKRSTYSSISAADICIESNRQRHAKAKQVINVLTEEAIKLNVTMKSTQIRPLPCDKFDNLF